MKSIIQKFMSKKNKNSAPQEESELERMIESLPPNEYEKFMDQVLEYKAALEQMPDGSEVMEVDGCRIWTIDTGAPAAKAEPAADDAAAEPAGDADGGRVVPLPRGTMRQAVDPAAHPGEEIVEAKSNRPPRPADSFHTAAELIEDDASAALWRVIRDVVPFVAAGPRALWPVWRIVCPPAVGGTFGEQLCRESGGEVVYDWGGGLIWAALPPATDGHARALRQRVEAVGGHAVLIRAGDEVRRVVDVFHPQPKGLAAPTSGLGKKPT